MPFFKTTSLRYGPSVIEYKLHEPCCHMQPTFWLLDGDMFAHFLACPGGLPEAPLIDWAWSIAGKPGGLFLDIGSHVGSWALPFAAAGMETIAFEPNPAIRQLIERASFDEPNLSILPYALSDYEGDAQLTAPGIDGGMASIVCDFGHAPVNESVMVTYLDNLNLKPSLMKVDVEGAEVDAIRGARRTIAEHQPVIFFECWEDERGQRREELFSCVTDEINYNLNRTDWPEMWLATPR